MTIIAVEISGRSAALPSHLSLSGGFAPGFIRSPLRGCASWTTCVDTCDIGSVESFAWQRQSVSIRKTHPPNAPYLRTPRASVTRHITKSTMTHATSIASSVINCE